VLLLLLSVCAGCKKGRNLTGEDLRSELRTITSVASETKLFIAQIREQRVTRAFAEGHFRYLRDQNEETSQDLTKASATGRNDAILREARVQAAELSRELSELAQSGQDPSPDSASRINQILSRSQALQASLR